MDIDGTFVRSVQDVESVYSLLWTPDGERLVYEGDEIYIVDSDGSNIKKIVNGQDPTLSPDGSHIAYELENMIYTCDIDGKNIRELTRGCKPSWSPYLD